MELIYDNNIKSLGIESDIKFTYNKNNNVLLFDLIKTHEYTKFINILKTMDESFDIDIMDNQHNTYLMYAVSLNLVDIVDILLEKKARLDMLDYEGRSIMYMAIKMDYKKIINLLLEYDKKNIGVTITQFYDTKMRIPLHYAIDFKNIYAIKKLLEYQSNANYCDSNNFNSLHIAVYTQSLEVCEIVLPYISNINALTILGDSVLHIACQFKQSLIVKLLIKHGANINIQNATTDKTPLMITIENNDFKTFKIICDDKNVNYNIQDVVGKTILHYIILENNYEMFEFIINNYINVNLWDAIDINIPLMIVLEKKLQKQYIDGIIEKTNFLLKNAKGNTCLHYFVMNNLWKEYKSYLIKKKLDITTKNKDNKTVYDLVDNKDKNEFINMIIDSYINRLKKYDNGWFLEWENKCFSNIEECKLNIKNKINILLNNKIDENDCYQKSYPVRENTVCITIQQPKDILYCTFSGVILDVFIGLLFLLKKHDNANGIIKKNKVNEQDCIFLKSIGSIINSECYMIQFEFIWANNQIFYIDNFIDNITKCKTRFIIIPLSIEMTDGSHSNYLIYDNKLREIERFEPHGATTYFSYRYNPSLLDNILDILFKKINIKYISPAEYLPKIGFLMLDIRDFSEAHIGDPQGFCSVWATWYTDMRLTYADIPRNKLVKKLIGKIQEKNLSFKNIIRDYSVNITDTRDKILKKANININDWINDKYNNKQINILVDILMKTVRK